MNASKMLNSGLHLCAMLGTAAFALADSELMLALLAVGVTGLSWMLSRGARVERPIALPRLAINLLVLATIVNAAMRAAGGVAAGDSVVSTLGQFLVFLTLIKLLDRRGPRDDSQMLTLSIFVAIAAMLTSAELVVGALLVGFVPAAVATAMLWQIRAGEVMVSSAGAMLAPGVRRPAPTTGRRSGRGFAGVWMAMVVAGSVGATAVFLLTPRIGGEFLGRFGVARQAQIGYTETVRLGESGRLSEDPTPVLDLMITGSNGENLGGPAILQYLRGGAKGWYNKATSTWEDGPSTQHLVETINANATWIVPWGRFAPPGRARGDGARRPTQRVTMRGEASNLFCLWKPETVIPDQTVRVGFYPETGTLRREQAWGPRFVYTVQSVAVDDTTPAPTLRPGFQEGPVRSLTDGIVRGMRGEPGDRQIALAIKEYLQSQFAYTTEMVAPPEGMDAIEFFLLDRKQGHCEYFASAMAAMCQSQGIPARVVTGYLATEFNSLTGQYVVRQSCAHAWAEVFIATNDATGSGRWERFDPSPTAEIERIHKPPGGLLAGLRGWYDALEFTWSSSVVGFDNLSQVRRQRGDRDLTQTVYSWSDRLAAGMRAFGTWMRSVRTDPSQIPAWMRIMPGVMIGLLALGVAGWRFLKRTRLRGASRGRDLGYVPDRPSGFYAKALRVLAREGAAKPEATPPERFVEELRKRSPEAAGALARIVELFYRTRFGAAVLSSAELADGEARVRQLGSALKRTRPARGNRKGG